MADGSPKDLYHCGAFKSVSIERFAGRGLEAAQCVSGEYDRVLYESDVAILCACACVSVCLCVCWDYSERVLIRIAGDDFRKE